MEQRISHNVTQSPMQALFSAPTKYKPLSSHRNNNNNNNAFYSSSSLASGSPATPKRQRVLGENNGRCNSFSSITASSPICPASNRKVFTELASPEDQKIKQKSVFHNNRGSQQYNTSKSKFQLSRYSSSLSNSFNCDAENRDPLSRSTLEDFDYFMSNMPEQNKAENNTNTAATSHNSFDSIQRYNSNSARLMKRSPSSFCFSPGVEDQLELDHTLLSPGLLTDDVFFETENTNINSTSSTKMILRKYSSSSSINKSSVIDTRKCSIRSDSEDSIVAGDGLLTSSINRSSSSFNNYSTNSGNGDKDATDKEQNMGMLQKHPSEMSRRDKSLGLLGEKFLGLFPLSYSAQDTPIKLVLDEVAVSLCTERRRIYDIVNVLESLEMATKVGKNEYEWSGSLYLLETLSRLQRLGEKLGLPALMMQLQTHGTYFRFPAVAGSASGFDNRREKSLGIICQKLLMLLLAAPQPKTLSMECAVSIIVCSDDAAPTTPTPPNQSAATTLHKPNIIRNNSNAKTSITRNNSNSSSNNNNGQLKRADSGKNGFTRNNSDYNNSTLNCSSNSIADVSSINTVNASLCYAGDGDSNDSSGFYSAVCSQSSSLNHSTVSNGVNQSSTSVGNGNGQQHRARGRRMYDIANVLTALGLVTRLPASRSLQYSGPTDFPQLDDEPDVDTFKTCQRQSLLRSRLRCSSSKIKSDISKGNSTARSTVEEEHSTPKTITREAAAGPYPSFLGQCSVPSTTINLENTLIYQGIVSAPQQIVIQSNVKQQVCPSEQSSPVSNIVKTTTMPQRQRHNSCVTVLPSQVNLPLQKCDNLNENVSQVKLPLQQRSISSEPATPVSRTEIKRSAIGGNNTKDLSDAVQSRARLPRINSESAISSNTQTSFPRKASLLFQAAEMALEKLWAEERDDEMRKAKEQENFNNKMKQVNYLVSPVYSRELMARKSQPFLKPRTCIIASTATTVPSSCSSGTFAVPTGTAPRSPIFTSRGIASNNSNKVSRKHHDRTAILQHCSQQQKIRVHIAAAADNQRLVIQQTTNVQSPVQNQQPSNNAQIEPKPIGAVLSQQLQHPIPQQKSTTTVFDHQQYSPVQQSLQQQPLDLQTRKQVSSQPTIVVRQQTISPLEQTATQQLIGLSKPPYTLINVQLSQQQQQEQVRVSPGFIHHDNSNETTLLKDRLACNKPLFCTIEKSRILMLNKNQSIRIVPHLPSPRIALSFQDNSVCQSVTADSNGTSETKVNISVKEAVTERNSGQGSNDQFSHSLL